MNLSKIRKIVIIIFGILVVGIVAYFFLGKTPISIIEKGNKPLSNQVSQPQSNISPTPNNASDNSVSVSTLSSEYRIGETVLVYVFNNLKVPIFVSNICGALFTHLERKVGSAWKSYDAFPTKDCANAPFTKFEASGGIRPPLVGYQLDLKIYERGSNIPFNNLPGTYRLEMNYTTHQNPTLEAADPLFVQIFSNEFRVE